ncbi:P-selectin-like [Halichondria panicea]|uniref:P-selectin-like n=1 Tax=Halichondria panicea TaxID=6063 RepID=UPI00312B7745
MCTGDGNSTGAFDRLPPTCEPITCPGLLFPNNGSIDFGGASPDENSTFIFNAVATYNCDTGFSLVGNQTRTCNGNGNRTTGAFDRSSPTCEPITCPALLSPNNGSIDFGVASPDENSTYAFNAVANYNCDTGFSLVGDQTRTCTGDGSTTTGAFDRLPPICEPITCPAVLFPNNGSIDFGVASPDENSTYAFNTVATYNCDTGFSLVGDQTRTCTGDGNSTGAFDRSSPACEPITCPALLFPNNGSIDFGGTLPDENSTYAFNAVATYNCDTGFSLVGDQTRTCTGDSNSTAGVFDRVSPTCEPITCPTLFFPNNGSIDFGGASPNENSTYAFNTVATYNCDTGFSLIGDQTRMCTGDGSRTTGAFNRMTSICEPITCPALLFPNNGSIDFGGASPDENSTFAFNTIANYNCDTGFSLVGDQTRTCTGDGNRTAGVFAGSTPTCIKTITCIPLADPLHGTVSYSAAADRIGKYVINVTATYSCDTGFSLVGNHTRTCTGDGNSTTGAFNKLSPTCEPITSLALLFPNNGSIINLSFRGASPVENSTYVFNAVATYICHAGFTLVGNNTRTCGGDGNSITGEFDGEAATCEVLVISSSSLILDVVIPVVSVVAVLALVVLGGAVYGYIQVISHLLKLKDPQTGTTKLL